MTEKEKPTIPESIFNYSINLVTLDAIRSLIGKLVPCDKINKDQVEDILAQVNQMYRDHNEAFEVEADDYEEEQPAENVHVNEEVMGGDEESDAQDDKPLDFEKLV